MTKEMYVTDLKKIKSLKIVCKAKKCEGAFVVPINKTDKIPQMCPFCHVPLNSEGQSKGSQHNLKVFFEMLLEIKNIDNFDFFIESEKEKTP